MTSQVFVIPTYKNGTNWAHLKPNREVPNMCDVKCTQPLKGTTFTNTLELAKLKKNYEFYECDCVRKRRTDLNAKRYRFLIKEQLIIYRNSNYNCKLDVPREVVLGLKTTKAETRIASYRNGSDNDCPPLKCEPLGEASHPAYNWSKEDAAGYLDKGYRIPLGYITWGCQGIPVTVYQYALSQVKATILPFIDRIVKFTTKEFICSIKPLDVIKIYPVSMSWTVDGVLKQKSNTSVLRVSPEKLKSKPETHTIACFLGNRTIKTMEFLVYEDNIWFIGYMSGSTKAEVQVLPPKRPFFLQHASERIDSKFEIRPPSLRTYGDYKIQMKVDTNSQEAQIYMNDTYIGKHQTNLETICKSTF
ncbi:unnamed protein product [Dibothriocephalus latus]|uniref:Uncharacterized protein n=1 Tax=Dibothriocephalus latus TaxID=60516 RepID=A0A3P7NU79_DIBLA|nr:unnamed protein product [Dibothriocephalus latus]